MMSVKNKNQIVFENKHFIITRIKLTHKKNIIRKTQCSHYLENPVQVSIKNCSPWSKVCKYVETVKQNNQTVKFYWQLKWNKLQDIIMANLLAIQTKQSNSQILLPTTKPRC